MPTDFQKIGSEPVLEPLDIVEETEKSFEYLKSRSSTFIDFEFVSYLSHYILPLNPTLHSWTIENLVKNAIDAIKGKGKITVTISETEKNIQIWVSDTGKGISKNQFKKILNLVLQQRKEDGG
ncbi:ATP-binding protein [Myroides ceti]|uniref:ATP-binding protein n=1 Tax=Paenimyroides ceti TaxID=395087 RepID=A0ABT8CXU5_9FLAO|nr:ATP-binding protein [Paenimyroides ceti]MDN3709352.1 ATP-binding protein [Paenimyroides ceti]